MIFELITFRITKAKAKVKFGVRYLYGPECEKSSAPININTKALDIFENPHGAPDPQSGNPPPPATKKRDSKSAKSSRVPQSKRYFPKSKCYRERGNRALVIVL